jgi:hypothetical protein
MVGEEQVVQSVIYATGLLVYLYLGLRVCWYCFLRSIDLYFEARVWMLGWIKGIKDDIDERMRGSSK